MTYIENIEHVKDNEYKNFIQKTIGELRGFSFIVEDYQRGYKWDFNQVLDLLNDIKDFEVKGKVQSYCLQPVAVKRIIKSKGDDNNITRNLFELVDGQQRLTTIYIILALCDKKDFFEISYKTRKGSEKFLNDIHLFNLENVSSPKTSQLEKELNEKWEKFLEAPKKNQSIDDNVDNYHFFQAALVINSFLNNLHDLKKGFIEKLISKVKVIWYEESTGKTANELFKNLNSGKISLSAANLIKALFILDLEKSENHLQQIHKLTAQIEFEQNKLASEWDNIEQQLHDSKFWGFIIGNITRDYGDSRIGYLFEILTDSVEHVNHHECYRKYSNKEIKLEWSELIKLFYTLKEWYENIHVYHRIGFLMRQNAGNVWKTLQHVYNNYTEAVTKDDFKESLDTQLSKLFKQTKTVDNEKVKIYSLDVLNYHNLTEVRNLLVMVNILAYERIMPDYRLDFDQFYSGSWSVEHIQPQNPKDLNYSNVDVYINELKLLLENNNNNNNKDIESRLLALVKDRPERANEKQQKSFLTKFNSFVDEYLTSHLDLHGIGNLTLLQSKDNSSLGNDTFTAKRAKIIKVFKQSSKINASFIPISTVQVFTKFHSKKNVQLKFWSSQDALDYKESINTIMSKYLPKK
jgi:uncharacterized protein with ParB-like and HNH nuclease domain